MFRSNFIEFFSRVHWTVPLIIFVPVILLFVYLAVFRYALLLTTLVLLLLAGLFFWTLTEYVLHRFVFHYEPSSEWGRRVHWTFHGVHHDYPSDPLRLVMVPSVSLPLASLFYLLFHVTLGSSYAAPFTAGFLTGYLFYDITHYAVHHFPIKGAVFGTLREWHMRHHFQDPDNGFGVSSPLWDHVFGTQLKRKSPSAREAEG
ncbi:sterol desaturase family protein [bacterium]|nr:sterol desaturase family protein [bacterium]